MKEPKLRTFTIGMVSTKPISKRQAAAQIKNLKHRLKGYFAMDWELVETESTVRKINEVEVKVTGIYRRLEKGKAGNFGRRGSNGQPQIDRRHTFK